MSNSKIKKHFNKKHYDAEGGASPINRYEVAALLAIIAIGLGISFWMYSGPNPFYDDTSYISLARSAALGFGGFITSKFAYGFLKILLLALSFIIFGYGQLQAILPSLVEYIALILLTFLISRRLLTRQFALLATLIGAMMPFVVAYVTRVLPDIGLGMMVALSIYALMSAIDNPLKRSYLFLSGFLLAATVYMNEQAFAFIGITAILLLLLHLYERETRTGNERRNVSKTRADNTTNAALGLRFYTYIALGVAAGLIVYCLVFDLAIGLPFFAFEHYASPPTIDLASELRTAFSPTAFGVTSSHTNQDSYPPGPFFLLSLPGALLGILSRKRKLACLGGVYLAMLAYFFFGPSSLSFLTGGGRYNTVPFVTRMLGMLALPIAFFCAYLFQSAYSIIERRTNAIIGILAVIILVGASFAAISPEYLWLKSVADGTMQQNSMLSQTYAYLVNSSGHQIISAYIEAIPGFDVVLAQYLPFIASFNSNFSTYLVGPSAFPSESSICPVNVSNSYLVAFIWPEQSTAENEKVNSWLAPNCTAENLTAIALPSQYVSIHIAKIIPR